MKRQFLFSLYQTPRGKLLQTMEAQYLKRCMTVSCKQTQLQIGGLGWEEAFVDCSLYRNYIVVDDKGVGCGNALKAQAKAYALPIKTESMDLVIIPHMLEFDAHRFRTMREVHRVLKPGGELVILNFSPFSFYVRLQFLWSKKLGDSWRLHFVSRGRVLDWLKLLNFEVLNSAEFGLDSFTIYQGGFMPFVKSLFSIGYGVKAVKRQYSYIPLAPAKLGKIRLVTANAGPDSNLSKINKQP